MSGWYPQIPEFSICVSYKPWGCIDFSVMSASTVIPGSLSSNWMAQGLASLLNLSANAPIISTDIQLSLCAPITLENEYMSGDFTFASRSKGPKLIAKTVTIVIELLNWKFTEDPFVLLCTQSHNFTHALSLHLSQTQNTEILTTYINTDSTVFYYVLFNVTGKGD